MVHLELIRGDPLECAEVDSPAALAMHHDRGVTMEPLDELAEWLRSNWVPATPLRQWWARLVSSGWGYPHFPKLAIKPRP